MIKKLLFIFLFVFTGLQSFAQINNLRTQYFDGNDTDKNKTLYPQLDTASSNVWQIGKPQKVIFDSAATLPNALMTDTINKVPINNVSRVYLGMNSSWWSNYVLAIQWKQKLDMNPKTDGGLVEFSVDSGKTWQNVFFNSNVKNLYGFDTLNRDTITATGEYAFSGTDSSWRNVWLCFSFNYLNSVTDSLVIRYTLKTGTVDNSKEGWMIDNLMAHATYVHTVKAQEGNEPIRIYPTYTTGIVNIETINSNTKIKEAALISLDGKVLQQFGKGETGKQIDIGKYPDGIYYLKVLAGNENKTFRVILAH
jgi:hypothetical protein